MQSSLIFIIFSLVLVTFCMTPDNEVSTVSNKNNTSEIVKAYNNRLDHEISIISMISILYKIVFIKSN